jgi:RND superfamily putative drug exporter
MKSNNIAARMGRWSASHWKTAVFGWIAFVILALVAGNMIGTKQIDPRDANTGQAHKADQILKQAGFQSDPQTEIVLVQSKTQTIHDAAFRSTVADALATVKPYAGDYKNLRSPLDPAHADQVTADGHTAMVEFDMRGTSKVAEKRIDPITGATGKIAARHPGFFVGEAGSISSGKALDDAFNSQLAKAGERSVHITQLVLLVWFGALVAAGILAARPLGVMGTLGLLAIPSHVIPMDQSVSAVVLLVGLAVGVDYSLFYLKREREERAAGAGPRAALEAAAATSGRSVLISGLTVMVAMAGLLFAQDRTYLSFGVATMTVVAVAMIGSLTVLPALLSRLGDKVEKGKVPFLHRLRREGGENRFWSAVLDPVLRHPVVAVVASAGALIVLALPVLHIHTSQTGLDALPKSIATVPTIDRLQQAFPGGATPALVAIQAPADSPAVKAAVTRLEGEALATGLMTGPIAVDVSADRTTTRVAIPRKGNGTDSTSLKALHELRDTVLPATIGTLPNAAYAVTGPTAASADENSLLKHSAPLVFGFVLTLAFILLLVSFRSIVIAAKAIVLNLLSVAAAYGVLVIIFQWGWGESLLNFRSNGGIASWLPIFLFVILFGLSMDYHVFILSRVREAFDRGMKTEDAVAHGIKTTAGVVTSAAVVMVGVFSIFATLPILDMKELGIGLAAAVLIDATIVRAVLLPAAMKLLGDWNWYLPSWLGWLPPRPRHRPHLGRPIPEAA